MFRCIVKSKNMQITSKNIDKCTKTKFQLELANKTSLLLYIET